MVDFPLKFNLNTFYRLEFYNDHQELSRCLILTDKNINSFYLYSGDVLVFYDFNKNKNKVKIYSVKNNKVYIHGNASYWDWGFPNTEYGLVEI